MSSISFLVDKQYLRTNFKSDNFSEINLLNYCHLIIQYMEFLFEKNFAIFDRLSIINLRVQTEVCVVLNQRLFKK